jgi:hypothetical protein
MEKKEGKSFYLLDQEVKVLGEFGSEACIPISLSV